MIFHRLQLSIFVILFLIISGCSSAKQPEEVSPSIIPETKTIRPPTATLLNMQTISPKPPTPVPTLSPTVTEVLRETLITTTATPTLTLPVTLPKKEAEKEIKELLKKQIDCLSACFWGITPNLTTLGEVKNLFLHLGFPLKASPIDPNVYVATPGYDNLWIKVKIETLNQVVKGIQSRIDLGNYKGPNTPRPWSAYSPENILEQYGKPSHIYFSVSYPTEPGFSKDAAWYRMLFIFDSQKLVVDYYRGEVKKGNIIEICPLRDQFTAIEIWTGENPLAPKSDGAPLEKVLSLTIDQFYDLLIKGTESSCFNIDTAVFINP